MNEVHDAKSYPAKEMKDGSVVVNPAVRSTRVFSEKNIVKYLSFLDFCKVCKEGQYGRIVCIDLICLTVCLLCRF